MQGVERREPHTVLLLMSGGLDCRLAACVLRRAGVLVRGVVFESPFFPSEDGRDACHALEIPFTTYNFAPDIIAILAAQKPAPGACTNPCVECRVMMLRRAGEMLDPLGCDFLATGEVLDQRPGSQDRRGLMVIAEESGCADLVVRPLSARLLEPTLPERDGWIDREKLLDLHGRGRKRQIALASEFGVTNYPSPTGGCRLTEPRFAERLRDMNEHEGLAGVRDIELLKVGRHFRIAPGVKLVVGRNAKENAEIEACRELYDLLLKADSVPGPSAILPITASDEDVRVAAGICASYSDSPRDGKVVIRVKSATGIRMVEVSPSDRKDTDPLRV